MPPRDFSEVPLARTRFPTGVAESIGSGSARPRAKLQIAGLLETVRGRSRGVRRFGCPGPGRPGRIAGLLETPGGPSPGVPRDPGGSAPDRGTPRDAPGWIAGSPAVWRERPGPGCSNRETPCDRPRATSRNPAIWRCCPGPGPPDCGVPRDPPRGVSRSSRIRSRFAQIARLPRPVPLPRGARLLDGGRDGLPHEKVAEGGRRCARLNLH